MNLYRYLFNFKHKKSHTKIIRQQVKSATNYVQFKKNIVIYNHLLSSVYHVHAVKAYSCITSAYPLIRPRVSTRKQMERF